MSRKHFSWLLVITVVVAVAVLLVPGRTGHESDHATKLLLPDLAPQVNDIAWMRIVGPGTETIVTLLRQGDSWNVEEAAGYRADWTKLKKLLADLAQAEIVETKTANPEYYDRLGVEDLSSPEAGGVLIEFDADSGVPALIVGKPAQGRSGRYVRLRDAEASALVDRDLDVPTDRSGWLDRAVIDIPDEEVLEVSISQQNGQRLRIAKVSADEENFTLQDIPAGREARSDWTVNAPAGALSALTLEDVRPAAELDWTGAAHYSLVTADRLVIDADLLLLPADSEDESAQDAYWIRLQAGVYPTALAGQAEQDDVAAAIGERAAALNRDLDGWAYRIPKYKYDAMVKRLDDLLKPPESGQESGD
jgi:hypothetical protein